MACLVDVVIYGCHDGYEFPLYYMYMNSWIVVQEISADLGGNTAKLDKSTKVSTVVDLDLLIDFGYGAHLRYLCLL